VGGSAVISYKFSKDSGVKHLFIRSKSGSSLIRSNVRPLGVVRRVIAGTLSLVVVAGGLVVLAQTAHAGTPAALVVLDPDNDLAHAMWNGVAYTELPITHSIAVQAKAKLEALCDTSVVITRDGSQPSVDRASRAAQMQNATVSMTLSLNSLNGDPWDRGPTSGGASSWSTNTVNNMALGAGINAAVTEFTGRPNSGPANLGGSNGTTLPYAEFAALPGTYTQAFLLYIDNNFDWPALNVPNYTPLVDAVVTAVGHQLQAQGITCGPKITTSSSRNSTSSSTAAPTGPTFPVPPTQAQLNAWRAQGYRNDQRYGADPINFATGNFLQTAALFTVSGPGGTSTPVSLTYNSTDSRIGRFGVGWSSGLDGRGQLYADKSVLITGSDGSSNSYTGNADGTYAAPKGIFGVLTRPSAHQLVVTNPDGSFDTYTQDAATGASVLTGKTDRAGHLWKYSYAGGTLVSLTEPGGQKITFTANAAGRVDSVSRPDGAKWALAYDGSGNLVSITDPLADVTQYGYDGAHRLLTATSPGGVTYVSNTYDSVGRVIKQVNGDGSTDTLSYAAGQTTYTDTTGAATTFEMDAQGRVTLVITPLGARIGTGYSGYQTSATKDANSHQTNFVYDANGNLIQRVDPVGAATKYTYTAQSDLASTTAADGRVTTYTVDAQGHTTAVAGPDGAKWQSAFDAAGDLTSRTDPAGHVITYAYDGHGNLTVVTDAAAGIEHLSYDSNDRLVSFADQLGRVTTMVYDADGNLTARTAPSGAVRKYSYNADNKVTAVADPNGHTVKYTYNNALLVSTFTDATGAVTSYGYDSEYRKISITDPDGRVLRYAYDQEGRLLATTDPAGKISRRSYDKAGNLLTATTPTGAVTTVAYDADNRPLTVTDPRGGQSKFLYDITGRIMSLTDSLSRTTTYTYDAVDRVVSITNPTGAVSKYGYDVVGNKTSTTDALNRVSTFAYDALNRIISSTDPAGAKTSLTYDRASQVISTTDPIGRVAALTYTPDAQVSTSTAPNGAISKYAYDPAGNITGITDPRGGSVTFGYDADNRRSTEKNQVGGITSRIFDAAGELTSMTDPKGIVTTETHDPRGLLTQIVNNATGTGAGTDVKVSTGYAYDDAGRLISTVDANANVHSQTYDVAGNLTSATDPLGAVTSATFDTAGQLKSKTDRNNLTTGYTYDGAGRLSSVTPPAGQKPISYTYDGIGRTTGMADGTGATTWTYTAAGNVASQTDGNNKTLTYTYNAAGQIATMGYPDGATAVYTHNSAGQVSALSAAGGSATTGSTALTGIGTTTYAYDIASELTAVARPNGTNTTYTYDPMGRVTEINHTAVGGVSAQTASAVAASTPMGTGNPAPASPAPSSATPVVAAPTASTTGGVLGGGALGGGSTTTPTGGGPLGGSASNQNTGVCAVASTMANCVLASKTAVTGLPLRLDYTYDPDSQIVSLTQNSTSGQLVTGYTYDFVGRLTASKRTDSQNASYTYDKVGNRTAATAVDPITGAALSTTAVFNAGSELTTQVTTSILGKHDTTTTVNNLFDSNGNLTSASSKTTSTDAAALKAWGAALGYLNYTNAAAASVTSYTYDFNNLLTSVTSPDPTAGPLDSASSQTLTSTWGYDGLGRAVNQRIGQPHFLNRLGRVDGAVGVTGSAATVTGISATGVACIDFTGTSGTCRTSGMMFGGGAQQVSFSGGTAVAFTSTSLCPGGVSAGSGCKAGTAASVTETVDLIRGPNGVLAQTDSRFGVSFLHTDVAGSARTLTNTAGTVVAAAAYTDFGAAEPVAGSHAVVGVLGAAVTPTGVGVASYLGCGVAAAGKPQPNSMLAVTSLGFTGYVVDVAHSLLIAPGRAYQPGVGVWVQQDPAGRIDPAGINGYHYADNDPITLVDRDGRDVGGDSSQRVSDQTAVDDCDRGCESAVPPTVVTTPDSAAPSNPCYISAGASCHYAGSALVPDDPSTYVGGSGCSGGSDGCGSGTGSGNTPTPATNPSNPSSGTDQYSFPLQKFHNAVAADALKNINDPLSLALDEAIAGCASWACVLDRSLEPDFKNKLYRSTGNGPLCTGRCVGVLLLAGGLAIILTGVACATAVGCVPVIAGELVALDGVETVVTADGGVAAEGAGALERGAARVPSAWGDGVANSKGVGTRWVDPANKGNGIRIDEGNPGSSFPSQQVDHVVVRHNGRVIGPDGQPITGSLSDNPGAHIPLSDWLKWSSWYAP